MSHKTYLPADTSAPASQIGATLEALAATIEARRGAGEESYTHRLLADSADAALKKLMEEAGEVALAAKDVESCAISTLAAALVFDVSSEGGEGPGEEGGPVADGSADSSKALDHLRYEAADLVYHLLVVLERYGIGLEEFAAELNARMTVGERPIGGALLHDEFVQRGK